MQDRRKTHLLVQKALHTHFYMHEQNVGVWGATLKNPAGEEPGLLRLHVVYLQRLEDYFTHPKKAALSRDLVSMSVGLENGVERWEIDATRLDLGRINCISIEAEKLKNVFFPNYLPKGAALQPYRLGYGKAIRGSETLKKYFNLVFSKVIAAYQDSATRSESSFYGSTLAAQMARQWVSHLNSGAGFKPVSVSDLLAPALQSESSPSEFHSDNSRRWGQLAESIISSGACRYSLESHPESICSGSFTSIEFQQEASPKAEPAAPFEEFSY